MADGCAGISVADIENIFVEFQWTKRKTTLVEFYDELSKKYIPSGSNATVIDLQNCTLIYQLNKTPLLNGSANSLLLTPEAHDFGVSIHDVAN